MQLLSDALTLDGLDWIGLDWTDLALPRLLPPKGWRGLLPGVHVTRSLGANKVLLRVRRELWSCHESSLDAAVSRRDMEGACGA